MNDNLLAAFKKRTQGYIAEGNEAAKVESLNFLNDFEKIRQKLHHLIITIKNDPHKNHIEKTKLYACIPESELDITAQHRY